MQLSDQPKKLVLAFAESGNKNPIPVNSQVGIVPGAASLEDGFPPLTMTPVAAGGVPPSGLDMNGILYEMSASVRYANAGGGFTFDQDFADDENVGGYPKGARVMRSDGSGYWLNTVDNNTTDPEDAGAAAAGWMPDTQTGVSNIALSNANVTLSPNQYGNQIITLTGTLTSDVNLIFPQIPGKWFITNKTTGAYSIRAKTAVDLGVVIPASFAGYVFSTGTAIVSSIANNVHGVASAEDLGLIPGIGGDQTSALAACLNDPRDIIVTEGTYVFTVGALNILAGSQKRLIGQGKVTFSVNLPANTSLCDLYRAVWLENITIDFNGGYLKNGFFYHENCGHIHWRNVGIKNIKDIDATYWTIALSIYLVGNTFDLRQIAFTNCLKRGNGVIGDSAGSFNGIYVGQFGAPDGTCAVGNIEWVLANEVHNINSSDVIIYEDTGIVYVATPANDTLNNVSISNIYGVQFGKRLVKLQASNVNVTNVAGSSTAGDTTSVVGVLSGGGALGAKVGGSVSHVRAYGTVEHAFYTDVPSVKFFDVKSDVYPSTLPGTSNAASGLTISADDCVADALELTGRYLMVIGSGTQVVRNTKLNDVTLNWKDGVTLFGLSDLNGHVGIDGVHIKGLKINVNSPSVAAIPINNNHSNATYGWKNVSIEDIDISSNGAVNSYGGSLKYISGLTVGKISYANTSGAAHYRILDIQNCTDVDVKDVTATGSLSSSVAVTTCSRVSADKIYSPSATFDFFNNSSTDVTLKNVNFAKVTANVPGTKFVFGWTVDTTANRPSSPVNGQPHYDTTLGKPIWYNTAAASWKDAAGTNV